MRFDRRKTYPGLGQINAHDSDTDRLVRSTIIPHRVNGVIKSPGINTLPVNVMQRFMGDRRWKFAASRMTDGGTSPFFGNKWTGVNAEITEAFSPVPFAQNIFVAFNQNVAAGIKSTWDVFVNGVSVNITGVQLQGTESHSKTIINIGITPVLVNGDVIEVSHVLPGQGIPIITKHPVINGH